MKKITLFGATLAVLSMLILTACGSTEELEEEIDRLESEISNLESENLRLEDELSDLEAENLRLEEELYYLSQEPEEVPLVGIPFEVDDLLGEWSNGTGDLIFGLSPNVSADDMSFLEDNTISINGQKMTGPDRNAGIYEETGVWRVTDDDLLEVFGHTLIVEIDGHILTMTNVDNENVRIWNRAEESDDPNDDDGADDDDDGDDDISGSSTGGGSSPGVSTTNDWRQFLRDYDAWMDVFVENLDNLTMIEESGEWSVRVLEIQGTLSGTDLIDFTEEAVRIGLRPLD